MGKEEEITTLSHQNFRDEGLTDEEIGRVLLSPVATRQLREIKKQIIRFQGELNLMFQIIPLMIEPDAEIDLRYFSNIYLELEPILNNITCYVNENGYKREFIDNLIKKSKKILELLKKFHLKFMEIKQIPITEQKINWYKHSREENEGILREILTYKVED